MEVVMDRVLLEKISVVQLVKKFRVFHGTRMFITMFARLRHWTLSYVRRIPTSPHIHFLLT